MPEGQRGEIKQERITISLLENQSEGEQIAVSAEIKERVLYFNTAGSGTSLGGRMKSCACSDHNELRIG